MPPSYAPSSLQREPPTDLRARVEAATGRSWLAHSKPHTGLSAAYRFIVELEGGSSIFVKAATTPETAEWLCNEHLALQNAPADLAPRVLAWLADDTSHPILIVEALCDGHWPAGPGGTNWRADDLTKVLKAIRHLGDWPANALPQAKSVKS